MEVLILIGIMLLLLSLRQSVILILFVAGFYVHYVFGDGELSYLIEDLWTSVDRGVLLAIPMFVLAGNIMTRGSIAERLINIMRALTQWLPGGLAVCTILSCAVFAALSGSSPVTLLAVGSIMYPALIQQGYPKSFSLGALASAGTLGIVIPPSIPLILYGIVTEKSIVDLFLAGIIPGLLLAAVLTAYSLFSNRKIEAVPFNFGQLTDALKNGVFALMTPVILLGGIYSGFFSATEAAAVAVGYALLVEIFIHRELKVRDFYGIAVETSRLLGTLLPIVAIALSINLLLTAERIPQDLAQWMTTLVDSQFTFLVILNIFLLIVGCLVDIGAAILILAPILMPIAQAYGIHPIHFGIIMVVNLEIGYITPPVGLNLIVAMTAFKEDFLLICKSVIPFIGLMLLVLIAVTWIPELSLYLIE
ncbi:MAG: TRAP transporter large permease [Minwuia sp.]|uniref:TRAP transporter large permease n=1 Tax=Minwuia sp. TaxID=2493630 RepID=UPI003A868BDD